MDVWLLVTKSNSSGPQNSNKHLTMLVTPYRKICDPQDHFYRACHRKNRLEFCNIYLILSMFVLCKHFLLLHQITSENSHKNFTFDPCQLLLSYFTFILFYERNVLLVFVYCFYIVFQCFL